MVLELPHKKLPYVAVAKSPLFFIIYALFFAFTAESLQVAQSGPATNTDE